MVHSIHIHDHQRKSRRWPLSLFRPLRASHCRCSSCAPARLHIACPFTACLGVAAHQGSESPAVLLPGPPGWRPCKPAAGVQRNALPDLLPSLHA
jgi:hypothetical protein